MVTQDQNKWYTLHVEDPWWTIEDFYNVEYEHSPFNDALTTKYWKKIGYEEQKFTGSMYGMPNEMPDWVGRFQKVFPWDNWSWQLYRMEPGCILPAHSDTYRKYKEVNALKNTKKVWRAVVFLEDWQSGHYFEIDSTNLSYWKKGDYIVWNDQCRHIAANIGELNRYTLQITGVID
jgi:hypothetical protein